MAFAPTSTDVRAWLTIYFTYRRARKNVNINFGLGSQEMWCGTLPA
jgi:hypothetical protein